MGYTKHMFDHFAHGIGKKNKKPLLTLKETWQQFNIAVALVIIKEVMDDKPDALDKAWWKLCYDVMNDYACFPGAKEEAEKKIMVCKLDGL